MFEIGKLFSHKPDHPMNSIESARKILKPLEKAKPFDALVAIGGWARSLARAAGFACDDRFQIVVEVESAGKEVVATVFQEYMKYIHKRDQYQRTIYEALRDYWAAVAAAYEGCVLDHMEGKPGAAAFTGHLPLAIARAIRASEKAKRMSRLRYVASDAEIWESVCRLMTYAEKMAVDQLAIVVYEHEVHTTIRAELLSMAGMSLAELSKVPPEQVELAGRILARFAVSFSWSTQSQPDCYFVFDLAAGAPPRRRSANEAPSPTKRYFGGGPALAKLAEVEALVENNLLAAESHFGPEFSQAQIVSVIRHMLVYLGSAPPQRRFPRAEVTVPIEIIHGFGAIAPGVVVLDAGSAAMIDEHLNVKQRKRPGVELAAETVDLEPELWTTSDGSEWGLGVDIPKGLGTWAEPGILCGVRQNTSAPWLVGIIRSAEANEFGRTHCGLWIMSKRPISTHLRLLGSEAHKVANWETSSGGFGYTYIRALLLPDAVTVNERPVMLIERQTIWIGEICELMAGEQSRYVRLMELIEEGSDYIRVGFDWMTEGESADVAETK